MNRLRRQLTNCSIKSIPVETIEDDLCRSVRDQLKKEQKDDPDKIDESDVQLLVSDFRYLRRFLQRSGNNYNKAITLVRNILIWRKEVNLHKFIYKSFPREYFLLNVAEADKFDLNGNLCLYGKARYFVKDENFKDMFAPFISFMYYKALDVVVERGSECGFTVITDLNGVSISQFDFGFALWGVDLVSNRLPSALRKMFIVDMPWFARPLFKAVLAFVPSEWRNVIRISSPKDLNKYIGLDNVNNLFNKDAAVLAEEPSVIKIGDKVAVDLKDLKSLAEFTDEEMIFIGLKPEKRKNYLNILDAMQKIREKEIKEKEKAANKQ